MLLLAAKVLFVLGLVYFITVLVLLFIAKLERNKDGNLVIDINSWHFKLAYPFKRYDSCFLNELEEKGLSICPYFGKLVWMLYIGWPCLAFVKALPFLVSLFTWVFGFYFRPNSFEEIHRDHNHDIAEREDLPLPTIDGEMRVLPIYLLLVGAYIGSLFVWTDPALHFTLIALKIILALSVVVGFVYLLLRFEDSKSRRVTLVKEWLSARKKKVCPIAEVRVGKSR